MVNNFEPTGSNQYPLKIYISKANTVVIVYTKAILSDDFELHSTTCVIDKSGFYKAINELKQYSHTVINDSDTFIKIQLYEAGCEITTGTDRYSTVFREHNANFQNWLLSIDLRNAKRVQTLIPISLQSISVFDYGAILDISQTGFKVALNSRLNVNEDVTLSIFDEEYPIGGLTCKVRHESTINDKFIYGLQIDSCSIEAELVLNDIINRELNNNSSI